MANKRKKVAIITSANKGLGLAICEKLGLMGTKVIIVCRNEIRGN